MLHCKSDWFARLKAMQHDKGWLTISWYTFKMRGLPKLLMMDIERIMAMGG